MGKKIYKMTESQMAKILNERGSKNNTLSSPKDEGLSLDVISELFSIHEEAENPAFYISKNKDNFGKPMMEKSDDCYHVVVNPEYKDLSFVFEVINDMYENKEFEPLISESEVICEECFELSIEKKLMENFEIKNIGKLDAHQEKPCRAEYPLTKYVVEGHSDLPIEFDIRVGDFCLPDNNKIKVLKVKRNS